MPELRSKVKLFSSLPLPAKIVVIGIVPPIFGGVVGLALGLSGPVYWLLLAFSVIGGLLAGYEHRGAFPGACRGIMGGTLFSSGLLGAHFMSGWGALALLPPPIVFVLINTSLGAIFGAVGGTLRGRAESVASMTLA